MPQFAANLSLLFTEHPFLDRFARAAEAGFTAVECQFPYAWPAEAMAERLAASGLTQVLINLPAGDWEAGERGIAILPERVGEFRDGVARAIDYAGALGCGQVNCLAGLTPAGADRARLEATFVANLAHAADALGKAGLRLLIEPINSHDVPGFFLTGTRQAFGLIAAADCENLSVQLDIYHAIRMQEDVPRILHEHCDRIAHIQIADAPGRHEPGTGGIAFDALFEQLDASGYDGFVGCEYLPAGRTEEGLVWLDRYRRSENISFRKT